MTALKAGDGATATTGMGTPLLLYHSTLGSRSRKSIPDSSYTCSKTSFKMGTTWLASTGPPGRTVKSRSSEKR